MTPQTGTIRFTTRALVLLFAALLALAGGVFNLRDRLNYKPVPTDGVLWREIAGLGIVADRVDPTGPASVAGVRRGDILIGISPTGEEPFEEVPEAQHVQVYLENARDLTQFGHPLNLSYWIERRNDAGDRVIFEGYADLQTLKLREANTTRGGYLALIGLIYLGIGLYFLIKRSRAPYVTHFFLLCLLAFMAHFYSATDEMRTQFDKSVDMADAFALILLAPMFVHFAAIYPARYHLFTRRRWMAVCLYIPAALLVLGEIWLRFAWLRERLPMASVNFRAVMSRVEIAAFGASFLVSAALMLRTYRQSNSIVARQQLKWVIWGMSVASIAFAVFYLPSYLATAEVSSLLEVIALAPLVLIPLTLGYSIVRYRLMDVDVVMRRSFAYIVATLSVAGMFGTTMAVGYEYLRPRLETQATLVIAAITMSLMAMLFAPVKNWVQQRIDRLFYGEKYDYRVTLQDFGRTLSSTNELAPLLDSLMRRLKEVFWVERMAIFVGDNSTPSGFRVARVEGVTREIVLPTDFLQQLREHSTENGIVRTATQETDDELEKESGQLFSYYVPCAARSRVVAVIALGRTTDGALLSSEDTDLLRAISGYVAVAMENALLLEEQAARAKELARLKEFNENIIESINVGVMVVNLAGRIMNWNTSLEEIYGLRRDETIGRRITEVFQSEMLHALLEMMERSEWETGVPVNVYKFRAHSVKGRELTLNISLAALQSRSAEVEGTLVAIEDVTERVLLEEQLQQNDKLSSIGLLAAGVAHEVNTPLTGISSYSQMLMQQIPAGDPSHLLLEKIHRQTSRASAIVNNLLNFSRVSDARLVPVDLTRVIDDTIQLLEAQLRNTEIEVVRAYSEALPPASGNAAKLQQVFMNLILNARDAMPHGGRLEISSETDDETVILCFRDTGVGIPAEHLARIYDPFFTTKQIGKGTGLGLAVSYGIIQDHGGHITVESKPGCGTLFKLTLPRIDARRQLAAAGD
ncbi:MAG: ATP-binding protein [Blastocatellia bacterium]|nr:ATP-binding protein [Blastocatellia bacterium]